jgi:hypothetical protein
MDIKEATFPLWPQIQAPHGRKDGDSGTFASLTAPDRGVLSSIAELLLPLVKTGPDNVSEFDGACPFYLQFIAWRHFRNSPLFDISLDIKTQNLINKVGIPQSGVAIKCHRFYNRLG